MKPNKRAVGLGYGTLSASLAGVALAGAGLASAVLLNFNLVETASAVDIKGSVRAIGDAPPSKDNAVRPAYWQEWNGFIEPKKPAADLAREVAVVLIGSTPTRDAANLVTKGGQLMPRTVVMQQGANLRVRNEDDFVHKLFVDELKAFNAIETASGQGRQVQIDQVGTFTVRDALSPHVNGTLHVLAKLTAVASPQADGSFVFAAVEPGSYTLKVFLGATEVSSKTLEVEDRRELVIDPINIDLKTRK